MSMPKAPNFTEAAIQTSRGNREAARYTTQANRVNQNNPFGSVNWTNNRTFDQAGFDAASQRANAPRAAGLDRSQFVRATQSEGGNGFEFDEQAYNAANAAFGAMPQGPNPAAPNRDDFYSDNWTQDVTLNPDLQAALTAQMQQQRGRSEAATGMMDRVRGNLAQPFNPRSLDSYLSGVNPVNQGSLGRADQFQNNSQINVNAPQFDPSRSQEYSRNAFEAQMALLRPEMDRADTSINNRLALQGLTPGTEASNNALSSFELARAAKLNSLASSSYLTGNQAARADFDSNLKGYLAGNEAQIQQFGLDQGRYATGLDGLRTNADLQGAENRAQGQAYDQALNNFSTNWQQDYALRTMPLNEMNALSEGTDVRMPQFTNFATQGGFEGPDHLGAATQQSEYDRGVYNAEQAAAANRRASRNQLLGSVLGIGGSILGGRG